MNGLQLNPKLPEATKSVIIAAWERSRAAHPEIILDDAVGILTSGSTGSGFGSIIVLSRPALETSAHSVNRHLHADEQDIWGLALPLFHVGGFSIPVRAKLAGARVATYSAAWHESTFHGWLAQEKVTLLSLVPTQLFDLVESGLRAPPHLRAVVIGGGKVEDHLHVKAVSLGWPVLQSYGLTECCSQVATAPMGSDGRRLEILDHVEVRVDSAEKLWIRSPSLFSGRIVFDLELNARFEVPVLKDGWFETSDLAGIQETTAATGGRENLLIKGREGDAVKVLGELVNLTRIRAVVETVISGSAGASVLRRRTWVVAVPHDRRGHELVLVVEVGAEVGVEVGVAVGESRANAGALAAAESVLGELRNQLAPFEIPTRIAVVPKIPRSDLGKVLSTLLTAEVAHLRL